MNKTQTLALFYALVLAIFTASSAALQVGFYKGKCGTRDVESIVSSVVKTQFSRDPTLVAALLRMQFHDCFVNVRLQYTLCNIIIGTKNIYIDRKK